MQEAGVSPPSEGEPCCRQLFAPGSRAVNFHVAAVEVCAKAYLLSRLKSFGGGRGGCGARVAPTSRERWPVTWRRRVLSLGDAFRHL